MINKDIATLVFEQPKWYVSTCRIFDEKGDYVGSFKNKEIGKQFVDIINNNLKNKQHEESRKDLQNQE
jgi:hypothetical protein